MIKYGRNTCYRDTVAVATTIAEDIVTCLRLQLVRSYFGPIYDRNAAGEPLELKPKKRGNILSDLCVFKRALSPVVSSSFHQFIPSATSSLVKH
jgi:hypothetical protein